MSAFLFYLATLGAVLTSSMILPALVAFGAGEAEVGYRILLYGALGGFLFTTILLAIYGRVGGLTRNSAIILAILSWIFFPALMAVPIADIAQISYLDALFQSMSSFTTTGAYVFDTNIEQSRSLVFLLSQIQWLGGFATLITLILVLAPWEIGGLPQVSSASVAASIVASQKRLFSFCASLFRYYIALTLICFFLLVLAGVGPFNSLVFSFSALSTGAVIQGAETFDLVLGADGMIIVAVFLMIGATSVFWHQDILSFSARRLSKHRESYFLIAVSAILGIYTANLLVSAAGSSSILPLNVALPEGIFNAASIVSTSGMQSRPGVFALLPATLVLLVVFAGGGCYSTSGGLKYFRIGGIFKLSEFELNRLIYPSAVRATNIGGTEFDIEFMKSLWSFFAVLVATLAALTGILSMSGLAFQPAFTAAIAAITNTGPLYGPFWEFGTADAWPQFVDMTNTQKIILAFAMFIGRLEIIAVFASLSVFIRKLV